MEMATVALSGAIGSCLTHSHSYSTNSAANHDKSSSPTTSKPAFQVSLLLRGPNKPHTAINHEILGTIAPPVKPNYSHTVDAHCSSQIVAKKKMPKKNAPFTTPSACSTSDVLHLMDALCLSIPPDMYISFIKECTITADSRGAEDLHAHISRSSLQDLALPLLNRLLLMNVSCGHLDLAHDLFDKMPSKDFKSWATMIVAYVNNSNYQEALSLFLKMLHHISMLEFPSWIMVCLLKTCVCMKNVDLGKQVHCAAFKLGHANSLFFASCLINFYGKYRCLESANLVFNKLPHHNTMTWMARLINNSREELFLEVLRDFNEVGKAGIKKNALMFSSVLKACGRIHDCGRSGRQVHANAIKLGFESNIYVQCGLVDMYGRSGLLREAKRVFEKSSDKRNSACWNAMLGGYIRNAFYVEAIKFVYEMKAAGVQLQQSLLDELKISCSSNSLVKLFPT
ncbi:hypothetical protein TIFTF001_017769 [Ficus carica]|uniref:Pentatricopeptide repeat-containing protein n=1 Tax=Ficus carica TaxID=3494 RepID=A0AA88AUU6_FICCA|nr:hypothetical protein TIFTF001_017769 [Ficus carica]